MFAIINFYFSSFSALVSVANTKYSLLFVSPNWYAHAGCVYATRVSERDTWSRRPKEIVCVPCGKCNHMKLLLVNDSLLYYVLRFVHYDQFVVALSMCMYLTVVRNRTRRERRRKKHATRQNYSRSVINFIRHWLAACSTCAYQIRNIQFPSHPHRMYGRKYARFFSDFWKCTHLFWFLAVYFISFQFQFVMICVCVCESASALTMWSIHADDLIDLYAKL